MTLICKSGMPECRHPTWKNLLDYVENPRDSQSSDYCMLRMAASTSANCGLAMKSSIALRRSAPP